VTESERIDPERLAALLDGRLSSREAAAVRAQLASAGDDTLSDYADAVAVTGAVAVEANGGRESVTPLPLRNRRLVRIATASMAAAAAIVLAVLLRRDPSGAPFPYASSVPASATLPTSAFWSSTRGTGSAPNTPGRSVRIGALFTDLQVAVQRRDTAAAAIAESIAANLDSLGGSAGFADRLRAAARAPSATSDLVATARGALQFVDEPLARAGAWLEAARLAAEAGDTIFAERHSADALSPLLRRTDIDPSQRSAVQALLTPKGAGGQSAASRDALADLLRLMGR
jgi:hypothetical protein